MQNIDDKKNLPRGWTTMNDKPSNKKSSDVDERFTYSKDGVEHEALNEESFVPRRFDPNVTPADGEPKK